MTTKDLAIGVLTITAVVLFSVLVIVQLVTPQPAMAFGQNARSGDFVVSTSQLDGTAELLFILDAARQRMNIYGFNTAIAQIELIQQIDLSPLQRLGRTRDEETR